MSEDEYARDVMHEDVRRIIDAIRREHANAEKKTITVAIGQKPGDKFWMQIQETYRLQ